MNSAGYDENVTCFNRVLPSTTDVWEIPTLIATFIFGTAGALFSLNPTTDVWEIPTPPSVSYNIAWDRRPKSVPSYFRTTFSAFFITSLDNFLV